MSKAIQIKNRKELDNWGDFNFKIATRYVYKLQKRIYRATKEERWETVRKLQKTIINSFHAKMLSVRKVAQINMGKKTAGIDHQSKLDSVQKLTLAKNLRLSNKKSQPVRRVWIPKPGKKEKRPLGIPTMEERAKQALVKLALEPEWSALFEDTSSGFRPGRETHDAMDRIYNKLFKSPAWILDGGIKGCFDNINHQKLLEKTGQKGVIRQQLKSWLKAGIIDFTECSSKGGYQPTTKGTPQGGIVSPLLANIALHGLEARIKKFACTVKDWTGKGKMGYRDQMSNMGLIRYADNFIVTHPTKDALVGVIPIIEQFFSEIGLTLHPQKTNIVSSWQGFDFLGFNTRHFHTGKYRSISKNKQKTGYTLLIRPSKESEERHYAAIRDTIRANKSSSQYDLINKLNPKIRGWCNYFRHCSARNSFHRLDHLTFKMLWKWAKGRHTNKSKHWIAKKYWHINPKWIFETDYNLLINHSEMKCGTRRTKLKDGVSIFDGNLADWAQRTNSLEYIKDSDRRLLKTQKGKCNWCTHYFLPNQKWERDHIVSRKEGGKNLYSNFPLLHDHCHREKTKIDLVRINSK